MLDNSSPFQGLPNELIVHIFTLAAASSSKTCLTLMLVAGWTSHLVLPYLFKTVVIRTEVAAKAFIDLLDRDPHCTSFVAAASLPFAGDDSSDLCYGIVQRCPNLIDIALLPEAFGAFRRRTTDASTVLPPSRELHITVLVSETFMARESTYVRAFANFVVPVRYANMSMPILAHVTRIDTTHFPVHLGRIIPFNALTHLTHARISFYACPWDVLYSAATGVLEKQPMVEMLVLRVIGMHSYDDSFAEWFWGMRDRMDGRIYATRARAWNPLEDWERAARSGNDIWHDAVRETEEWRLSREEAGNGLCGDDCRHASAWSPSSSSMPSRPDLQLTIVLLLYRHAVLSIHG
ncbi:hypothetical protein PLICRDRAFT_259350 [Plicaturopsis crispa FD-325 SS-3]|nr:hypothetical protein PLICRDRAFT_259350 [Plicaturopsis crispa FD-325 SS-3]